ncbi:MAG: diguanylate cyclase [bacterium]
MSTVLIIDDSETARRQIIKILEETDIFDLHLEAEDGAQGLKTLTEIGSGIDVVACDVSMPVMDGYNFLRMVKAREELKHIPVIMVTAETDVEEIVRAFDLGASDYITRPITPSILKVRLQNMLRIKQLQDQLMMQKDLMEVMATTDPLTQIPNIRYFRQWLDNEFARSTRYGNDLTLVMIDIDHFKNINDTYGHPQGDRVLKEMAELFKEDMRKIDIVARYGGEEFVIALPQTGCDGGVIAAMRVKERVENHRFGGFQDPVTITVSLGVCCLLDNAEADPQKLIDEADQALYRAKRSGRNRVEAASNCKRAAKTG